MNLKVLLIDDDGAFLAGAADALQRIHCSCEQCDNAEDAYTKVRTAMYDVIICDVLIPFRGHREGGLILAEEFCAKYPSSSVVLTSQYVTVKWVNALVGRRNHVFVEKNETVWDDIRDVVSRIGRTRTAFVCMPFDRRFTDIYELGIKAALAHAGFRCVRADEIQHSKGVLAVISEQIAQAHIIVADMTGQNANVYYEVGYAHALGKEVVLLTQTAEDIPFDLRGYNHIVYEGHITRLKAMLAQRLTAVYAADGGHEQ